MGKTYTDDERVQIAKKEYDNLKKMIQLLLIMEKQQ
ncbi:hypothetical protein IGI58_002616 [Enterococcus sp. AZ020]